MECTQKGECGKKKKCVNACRRFMSYDATAQFLNLKKRERIPLRVYVYIMELYGMSTTGFQQTHAGTYVMSNISIL